MVKNNSVKSGGQIVKTGVNRVAITDEFGDGLLARESGVCAGNSCSLCAVECECFSL